MCHFLRDITHLIFFETGSFIGPEVTHWSGWLVNPRAHSASASQVQGLHVQASGQQSAFLAFYVDAGSQTQSSHMHGKHFPSCVISFLTFSFMSVCLSVCLIYLHFTVLSLTSKAAPGIQNALSKHSQMTGTVDWLSVSAYVTAHVTSPKFLPLSFLSLAPLSSG